ncbi:hypothetical protein BDP27DRAFT_1475350, partial [Rhodocollybia butyracea]
GLNEFAKVKVALRKGQAHDAIWDLQDAILHIKSCIGVKYKNSSSQERNIHSTKYIRAIRNRKDGWAEKYHHAHQCLVDLGHIDAESERFPWLADEDMYLKNIQEDASLGQASQLAGWIWGMQWFQENGGKDLKSVLEGKRILWHQNRVDTLQYIKEVELLEAKFRWFIQSCEVMNSIWREFGSVSSLSPDSTSTTDNPSMRAHTRTLCNVHTGITKWRNRLVPNLNVWVGVGQRKASCLSCMCKKEDHRCRLIG